MARIAAKKSLGQHFLTNERVTKSMCVAGGVKKGDIVVEVGPGTGILTKELLRAGARVIAIEADSRAVAILSETFSAEIQAKKLTVFHADVRTTGLQSLGVQAGKYKVLANIPYYLSGMLFRYFLETEHQPSDLVFLVQKEVAERIARDPKESILSLSVKVFGDPRYVATVKRGNFSPAPKVDSAILAISGISRKRLKGVPEECFFRLLHEGFKSRRKQFLGNLSSLVPRETLTPTFSTLGLPSDARAEDIPLEKWLALCRVISPLVDRTRSPS